MNLDELRSVQSKERQKDSLQNLRPSFYQEVGEYIADLEDERDRAAETADDPFASPEVSQLTDEIETAKDVVEAIYERRMGKLVKQASLSAAGMAANDEGLTAEEVDLFDDLVDRIQSNKNRVLDVLEGVEAETGTLENRDQATTADRPSSPADQDRSAREPADQAPSETPPERIDPDQSVPDSTEPTATGDATPGADSSGVSAADVMGGDPPESPEQPDSAESSTDSEPTVGNSPETPATDGGAGADEPSLDRLTVKITEDVGSILGVDDREYTLAADDVVTLPEQNATPLVEREAAEQLD